jgi:hypothetical protein
LETVDIHITSSAVERLQLLAERFAVAFPNTRVVLNLAIQDEVVIFGLVPPEIKISESYCYKIMNVPMHIDNLDEVQKIFRTNYIDVRNDFFFIRARGPGTGEMRISIEPLAQSE